MRVFTVHCSRLVVGYVSPYHYVRCVVCPNVLPPLTVPFLHHCPHMAVYLCHSRSPHMAAYLCRSRCQSRGVRCRPDPHLVLPLCLVKMDEVVECNFRSCRRFLRRVVLFDVRTSNERGATSFTMVPLILHSLVEWCCKATF